MVRITPLVSQVRMSALPPDGSDKPPYEAACNLSWHTERVVAISMLNGTTPRFMLRELLVTLDALGVETVLAERAEGRLLPRLFRDTGRTDGHREMDVRTAMGYLR